MGETVIQEYNDKCNEMVEDVKVEQNVIVNQNFGSSNVSENDLWGKPYGNRMVLRTMKNLG